MERGVSQLRLRRAKTSRLHTQEAIVTPCRGGRVGKVGAWPAKEYEMSGIRLEARMQPRVDPAGEAALDQKAAEDDVVDDAATSAGGERERILQARARFAPLARIGVQPTI